MSSSTIGPHIPPAPILIPSQRPGPVAYKKSSSISSLHSLSSLASSARSLSSNSVPFVHGDVEVVTEEGVRHADTVLEARRYKTSSFATALLDLLVTLRIPTWSSVSPETLSPQHLKIYKVSGSLTNAVFFVSYPEITSIKTVLLRIYGPSSSSLISRPRELHTLHVLSSQYRIGPRIFGTFGNGRLEEYFDSVALSAAELHDPQISGWIGARMAELHLVDIEAIEETTPSTRGENVGWEIAARKNVRSWLRLARSVLSLPGVEDEMKRYLDLDAFTQDWERYMRWLADWERIHGASRRVFAHNDAQYGNLLRLSKVKEHLPEHRHIIVVDFEYSAPNPAAFDIANHFHEWTADYHSSRPHILNASRYPDVIERRNFYRAYLTHACEPLATKPTSCEISVDLDAEMQLLDEQVRVWSPASHAMWAVWGIVQARDDLEAGQMNSNGPDGSQFDYLGYARCRMGGFRQELNSLEL